MTNIEKSFLMKFDNEKKCPFLCIILFNYKLDTFFGQKV